MQIVFIMVLSCVHYNINSLRVFVLNPADPEASVQEQALAVVRNLVDGSTDCIKHVFAEDFSLLHAVVRQMQSAAKAEVVIQVMSLFIQDVVMYLWFSWE